VAQSRFLGSFSPLIYPLVAEVSTWTLTKDNGHDGSLLRTEVRKIVEKKPKVLV
jgi:hypothetical protein